MANKSTADEAEPRPHRRRGRTPVDGGYRIGFLLKMTTNDSKKLAEISPTGKSEWFRTVIRREHKALMRRQLKRKTKNPKP